MMRYAGSTRALMASAKSAAGRSTRRGWRRCRGPAIASSTRPGSRKRSAALIQVFDDFPGEHHHPHMVRSSEDRRVFEGVGVEHDEVGALAVFDGADLLLDAHQGGVRTGGGDDRVHGAHHARLAGDLLAFLALHLGQYIRSGSDP